MHELSLCSALLEQVEQIAHERGAQSVAQIVLRVGPLSGAEPGLLKRAYPLAAAGTCAEHAELVVETTDVIVRCTACGAESHVPPNRLLCASCGDFRTRIVGGEDLILERVELASVDRSRTAARVS